jgi:glutamine amidotransferase
MITIIDSGIANVGSVLAAFARIGAAAHVTTAAADVATASALVLPGVGAFKDGMDSLRAHGLVEPIREAVRRGTPMLGICLGMQLLADVSEEFGEHEGLGLVPGRVVRLEPRRPGERVPNIGWCDARISPGSALFSGIEDGSAFYFVHSFHLRCAEPADVTAAIDFGDGPVAAAVERGHVFGAQFHPEKSQDVGLTVLHNYVASVDEVTA